MKIYCIGIGPGGEEQMTLRAVRALETCDCVAGYGLYLDLIDSLIEGKERIQTGMTREVDRCTAALERAKQGRTVAVVSSGDAGVYGMAGLLIELAAGTGVEVEVIPGITAACSGGAVLGSPLTCDFACISLSDLLTPWDKIEQRLRGAAAGDFCIALCWFIWLTAAPNAPTVARHGQDNLRENSRPGGQLRASGERRPVQRMRRVPRHSGRLGA